jgi:hypothetical protein
MTIHPPPGSIVTSLRVVLEKLSEEMLAEVKVLEELRGGGPG